MTVFIVVYFFAYIVWDCACGFAAEMCSSYNLKQKDVLMLKFPKIIQADKYCYLKAGEAVQKSSQSGVADFNPFLL